MKTRRMMLIGLLAGAISTVSAQDIGKLADADNGFAFDLLRQIAGEEPGKNIFISPFGVSSTLKMVANGAAGDTRSEIGRVLKTIDFRPADVNARCKYLDQSLGAETNVILNLANGVWYQKGFHLKPGFITDNTNFFKMELAAVDFSSPKTAEIINGWADTKTHGKIHDVVQFPFSPLAQVILADAIYFKGKWAEPFDKNLTRPRNFRPVDGGPAKRISMMSQQKTFDYQEGNGFQAVRLPYTGNRMQMFLFLPTKDPDLKKLLANFTGAIWRRDILSGFSKREGTVVVPKFKLDYDISLNQPLQALGLRQAFSSQADFSAMADEPLFIAEMKQKSFIAVDEEGTEAAAVTTVMMATKVEMKRPPPFEMILDHPFFFAIADAETQAILFMGIVSDPAN